MAIEIYDEAKIIKKESVYYYLIRYGSKNCYALPDQRRIGKNLKKEWVERQSRESVWSLIATGSEEAYKQDKIAETRWNAPTSKVYGKIHFGNRKNIAYYLTRKEPNAYEDLSQEQKINFDAIVSRYSDEEKQKYVIDLDDIDDSDRMQEEITCGGKEYKAELGETAKEYKGKLFWDINNL